MAIAAGQIVLVRVEYAAHFSEGTWKGTLEIRSDSWDTISVPLSLFLAEVRTDWADASLSIARGQTVSFPVMARLLAGPATPVFYEMSTLQLDTGISLVPSTQSVSVEPRKVAVGSLTFHADPNAPLGENTLFVDQIAFNKRRGNLLPVIVGDHPSASVDDSIRWSLASEQGIQIDDGGTVWHSGRLRDVLVTASREILVAAETGGVWAVTRDGQSVSLADWDKPDVNCLAQGPDGPQHVYAAGQGLFETDVLSGIPLLSWKEIPLIDATATAIVDVRRMVVLPQSRHVVLVASGGVYWANISAVPVASRTYSFQKVPALPDGGRGYLGVAVGPNEGIAVAMWGTDARRATIFSGRWEGGQPALREAAFGTGAGQLAMYATTLTSCQADPSRMYAISSDVDGYPSVALRSDDGGASWNILPIRLDGSFEKFRNAAGNQGNDDPPNINIAVSPRQKDTVLIGWRHEGLFCSVDAGMSWTLAEGSPHMHSDLRALHFDPTDSSGRQVYVCSDGGLVGSPNLLQSFESGFNRRLPTLQFASPFDSSRSFWGTFGSSPVADGLVGGGTQDNRVVYASLEPSPTPWRKLDGGDGQLFTILQDGQALFYINDPGSARRAVFNQQRFGGDTVVPFANIEKGLEYPVAERVQQPFWRNSDGQVLSAVAGSRKGDAPFILGCFGEGPDLHWVQLRLLSIGNSFVSAVGSLHGDEILAGTGDGRMFAYAPASGALEDTRLASRVTGSSASLPFARRRRLP